MLNRSCSGWVGLDLSMRPFWINEWTRPAAVRTEQLHCTARCWSTEPGKKRSAGGQENRTAEPQGACGSREACGCGLPSYLPGPSRWRWQCSPRARDHVACRWLDRPVFFSLACRHRRRVYTHGPPCRLLERSAEARGLVTRNGRGTVDCEKPVHEHIHKIYLI